MTNDTIECPLIDEPIEIGACVIYSDIAGGMIKERCLPDKFKVKSDWRDICNNYKYHGM